MKIKRMNVRPFFTAVECECGGVFKDRKDKGDFLSNPPQGEFICNKCKKVVRLSEPYWPKVQFEILEE